MSERELIIVYGKPGTYENLGKSLAEQRDSDPVDIDRLATKIGGLADYVAL